MANLQFRTFTFPINPEQYQVTARRTPQYDSTGAFTGLGPAVETVAVQGLFCGSDAVSSYQALAALLDGAAGSLVHPVLGTRQAYLTELTLTQPPAANRVAYSCTFRPADSSGGIPR